MRQEIDAFLALEPLKSEIRAHPGAWLLGSALAGALAARLIVPPLWRQRGQLAGSWVRARLKDAVLGLAAGSVRTAGPASEATSPLVPPDAPAVHASPRSSRRMQSAAPRA